MRDTAVSSCVHNGTSGGNKAVSGRKESFKPEPEPEKR